MMEQKKHKLYMLVGVPGSGKSTWIQNHIDFFKNSYSVISRDAIRFAELKEDDDYFSKENIVWDKYVFAAKNSLKENENTILDATHLNEKSRAKVLNALKDCLKDVEINTIVMNTSLNRTIAQNNMREGRSFVPLSAVRRMNSQLTMPTLEEGFDNIYIYNPDKENKYTILRRE